MFKFITVPTGTVTLSFLLVTSGGLAQSSGSGLEEVVVTSSRIPTPLHQLGTSVSVLSQETIEAHGNLALVDILRQLPGTQGTSNGGTGQPTSLRIRGEEGYRTLTLFDGMRLLDPSLPQIGPQLEQVLSTGVGRVEVLRGPQGLSYGADAGGVVNLFTRREESGWRGDVGLQSGEFGTRQLTGSLSGRHGGVDYFLSAVDLGTDGFNSRLSDTTLRDADGYDNRTLHGRLGAQLTDEWRVDLVRRQVHGESEFDGCFAATVVQDCLADYRLEGTRLGIEYNDGSVTHALSYAETDTRRKSYALGELAFGNQGDLARWEYTGSLQELRGFDLVFGADRERAEGDSASRANTGVFLEALSDFSDRLFVTAGVRHDDNDDFGSNTSYRLSVATLVDLDDGARLRLRSALGTGFRAPSLFEVDYNTGPFAYPPASLVALEQETSRGVEFGIEYLSASRLRLEAVVFSQRVEDAIYFDLAGFSGYLQDLGTSHSRGVELAAALALTGNLDLSANATFNDTERPDGRQRIRRPERLANLALNYRALDDRLRLDAFYRVSRDSIDEVFGSTVALDDFEVLDLSISYQWQERVRLFGRIENALDADYQEISDYRTAGRAVYAGVSFSFR